MFPTRAEILAHTKQVMIELFEIEPEQLTESALLYDDLDIDSIDTVDLLLELKKFIKQDIDAQRFKEVRTLGDVVDVIDSLR